MYVNEIIKLNIPTNEIPSKNKNIIYNYIDNNIIKKFYTDHYIIHLNSYKVLNNPKLLSLTPIPKYETLVELDVKSLIIQKGDILVGIKPLSIEDIDQLDKTKKKYDNYDIINYITDSSDVKKNNYIINEIRINKNKVTISTSVSLFKPINIIMIFKIKSDNKDKNIIKEIENELSLRKKLNPNLIKIYEKLITPEYDDIDKGIDYNNLEIGKNYKKVLPYSSIYFEETDEEGVEYHINDILYIIMRYLKCIRYMIKEYGENYNDYSYIWDNK